VIGQGLRPAEEVRAAVRAVLARGELRERESLLERILEWLAPELSSDASGRIQQALVMLLVVGLGLALAALVRRSWQTFRAPAILAQEEARASSDDAQARARRLVDAARAARSAGDLRAALQLYFQALFLFLGGRGDLELNPAWTQRELLRRGRAARVVRERLEPLVSALEPKEFGRARVEARDVERLEAELAPFLAGEGRRS
jgi:hypothetical protein